MEKIEDYTLLRSIGGGNYGKVYLAEDSKGQKYAIKKIITQSMNQKLISLINNEIRTLEMANNPSILSCYKTIRLERCIYIVMEYCAGGDLESFIQKNKKVPVFLVQKWLKKLILALKDLRLQNIVHRDLKLANLMLTKENPETAEIKIGDFGFAKFLGDSLTSTQLGTPLYMAPEIFFSEYNYKVDI